MIPVSDLLLFLMFLDKYYYSINVYVALCCCRNTFMYCCVAYPQLCIIYCQKITCL